MSDKPPPYFWYWYMGLVSIFVIWHVYNSTHREPLDPFKVFPPDPNREIRVQLERKMMEKQLAEVEDG